MDARTQYRVLEEAWCHLVEGRWRRTRPGTIKDKYHYLAFGSPLDVTFSTGQPNRYTGKPYDMDAGMNLYYYGARYYDAELGRFTQGDPLRNTCPSWGAYAYTLDNPLSNVDPDGRQSQATSIRSSADPFSMLMFAATAYAVYQAQKQAKADELKWESRGRQNPDTEVDGSRLQDKTKLPRAEPAPGSPKIPNQPGTPLQEPRTDRIDPTTAGTPSSVEPPTPKPNPHLGPNPPTIDQAGVASGTGATGGSSANSNQGRGSANNVATTAGVQHPVVLQPKFREKALK